MQSTVLLLASIERVWACIHLCQRQQALNRSYIFNTPKGVCCTNTNGPATQGSLNNTFKVYGVAMRDCNSRPFWAQPINEPMIWDSITRANSAVHIKCSIGNGRFSGFYWGNRNGQRKQVSGTYLVPAHSTVHTNHTQSVV